MSARKQPPEITSELSRYRQEMRRHGISHAEIVRICDAIAALLPTAIDLDYVMTGRRMKSPAPSTEAAFDEPVSRDEWARRDRAAIRLDAALDFPNIDDFHTCFDDTLTVLCEVSTGADSLSEVAIRLVEKWRDLLPAGSTLDPQVMARRDLLLFADALQKLHALMKLVDGHNTN